MLIENQLVSIKISNNSKYYRELGYDVKQGDEILVPPQHLYEGSHTYVKIQCDICGDIIERQYRRYLSEHTYGIDACKKCAAYKIMLTMQERYGVDTALQNEEFLEKAKKTNVIKYGYEVPIKNEDVKRKAMQTNLQKYNAKTPFESDEIQKKIAITNIERYGVSNPSQSPIIRKKVKQTCLERYGVEHPSQVKEFREKAMKTLTENNVIPTSSQQIKLYELIKYKYPNAELNYPFSSCSLDIFVCINDIKIDIEYDGGYWHQDYQKDIKRDKFLQSQGFKVLRIRSGHLLPTEQELFDAIDCLVNTERHFKKIILSDWKECDE